MSKVWAAFLYLLLQSASLAQNVQCSTVVEVLQTGERYVGFTLTAVGTREDAAKGITSVERLGATKLLNGSTEEFVTAGLSVGRHIQGNAPNMFYLLMRRPSKPTTRNGSIDQLVAEKKVGSSGVSGSHARLVYWAGRSKYKSNPEQYLSSELSYSYSTDTAFIEHTCVMCSPKLETCLKHQDPKALQLEAQKLNATLVDPKLF